jgi:AraC-like DNA-binding protein
MMSGRIATQQDELADLIERHAVQDGVYETAIPSLFIVRVSQVTQPVYRVYNPCFCFIARGFKDVLLAQERYEYGPADYLISSMNLPVIGHVIKASPDAPYLSLKLEFTRNQILEVLNEGDIQIAPQENTKRAMFVGEMELSILDATMRLARLLDKPKDIQFLAPFYTKEILYRLLQGQYGITLAQVAMEGSSSYRIREAIDHIIHNVDKPLRIEELAEIANMGISTFHRHFKEATAMSPIQFQKQLRLQEARRLLMSESTDAADVAFRVGYESASQFSREYSRMFGFPPREDIKRLKATYEQRIHA